MARSTVQSLVVSALAMITVIGGTTAVAAGMASLDAPSSVSPPGAHPVVAAVDRAAVRHAAIDGAVEDAQARLRTARRHERVATSELHRELYERDQLVDWFGDALSREAVEARNSLPAREERIKELEEAVDQRRAAVETADAFFDAVRNLHAAATTTRIDHARLVSHRAPAASKTIDAGLTVATKTSHRALAAAQRELLKLVPRKESVSEWPTVDRPGFRVLTLDDSLVALLRRGFDDNDAGSEDDGDAEAEQPMVWPGIGAVNSGFGWRIHPVWGGRRMHDGIDIDAPYGADVVATADGEVILSGWNGGYGRMVKIDHGDGLETRYAHLQTLDVEVGEVVRQGDRLGSVGATGTATDAHIHFEVRVDGDPVDPLNWLP